MLNLDAFNSDVLRCLDANRDAIDRERLELIHPQSFCYKNSVNILVGKQGTGKTFSCAYEIAKISHLHPETHLLIIICKDENKEDPTIKSLKSMINLPIEYVNEDEAEDYMRRFLNCKRLYDEVKTIQKRLGLRNEQLYDAIRREGVEDEEIEEMYSLLKINDFSRDYLHTILLFNDIAKSKLFSRATNYFNQLLPICRHIQCSFFMNVQFWKSLPPEIKANATTIVIFGGFDQRQLYYIFSQVPTALSTKNIIPVYQRLAKHDKLIVNCETGDIQIESALASTESFAAADNSAHPLGRAADA